ncbi:hypothetical protein QG516_20515 [Pedobacter gandavensis]|nr:hypothetical protein [Pedobacter gandavensis]WGQ08898.1 hypothetical protein QG516_20515 [Pedobacter gandavensis]
MKDLQVFKAFGLFYAQKLVLLKLKDGLLGGGDVLPNERLEILIREES